MVIICNIQLTFFKIQEVNRILICFCIVNLKFTKRTQNAYTFVSLRRIPISVRCPLT